MRWLYRSLVRIESNITDVTSRFRQYRADVETGIQRTLRPETWLRLARHYAEKTLLALAQPNERAFIPDFVKAVTAVVFNGLLLSLDASSYTRVAAQMNLGGIETGRFNALDIPTKDLIEFEQQILQWVQEEKDWDVERDGAKNEITVREKADWIAYILLAPQLSTVSTNPAGTRMSEQEARDSLLPVIAEYLQRKTNAARLPAETADLWLRAVLLQWTAMVHNEFPTRLRAELHLMRRGARQKKLL